MTTDLASPTRLFIGGLPTSTSDAAVSALLAPFGTTTNLARHPRGFAHCTLPSSSAVRAVAALNRTSWRGSLLRVERAREHYLVRMHREWDTAETDMHLDLQDIQNADNDTDDDDEDDNDADDAKKDDGRHEEKPSSTAGQQPPTPVFQHRWTGVRVTFAHDDDDEDEDDEDDPEDLATHTNTEVADVTPAASSGPQQSAAAVGGAQTDMPRGPRSARPAALDSTLSLFGLSGPSSPTLRPSERSTTAQEPRAAKRPRLRISQARGDTVTKAETEVETDVDADSTVDLCAERVKALAVLARLYPSVCDVADDVTEETRKEGDEENIAMETNAQSDMTLVRNGPGEKWRRLALYRRLELPAPDSSPPSLSAGSTVMAGVRTGRIGAKRKMRMVGQRRVQMVACAPAGGADSMGRVKPSESEASKVAARRLGLHSKLKHGDT